MAATRSLRVTDHRFSPGAGPKRRWPVAVVCFVAYAAIALAAYWPTWPGDPHRFVACSCGDPSEAAWFLAWTPHALLHGVNPFFTTAINHPVGINLAVNTGMPLLGLVTAPVTLAFGPVASLNLLLWLAYPISASAMLFVLRRWTRWLPAAFAGGLLYGFSPYMIGQGRLHLQLAFVPLPPLVALAVYELFVRRRGDALRWGAVLGGLVVAQFFISTEILASTSIVAVLGLVVLGVERPRDILTSARAAAPGVGVAVAIILVLVGYPAWMIMFGPQRYSVPVWVVDLVSGRSLPLGPLLPTASMAFSPTALTRLGGTSANFTDTVENGSYLGIPLLLLVAYLTVRFWNNRWLRWTTVMALVSFVMALGPHLDLPGGSTSIALPFVLIERVPLVELVDPVRLSLFVALFVALALALGLDELHAARGGRVVPGAAVQGGAPGPAGATAAEVGLVAVLAATSVLFLIPKWPVATVATAAPPYFTSSGVERIPPGSTVLSYPYPTPGAAQPMLWQALSGMRYETLGSYALNPGPDGDASQFPTSLVPADVQRLFYGEQGVQSKTGPPFPLAAHRPALVVSIRRFLTDQAVGTVVVERGAPNAGVVAGLMEEAMARPPDRSGGIDAWYDVGQRVPSEPG
jgi:hypothetical protein